MTLAFRNMAVASFLSAVAPLVGVGAGRGATAMWLFAALVVGGGLFLTQYRRAWQRYGEAVVSGAMNLPAGPPATPPEPPPPAAGPLPTA